MHLKWRTCNSWIINFCWAMSATRSLIHLESNLAWSIPRHWACSWCPRFSQWLHKNKSYRMVKHLMKVLLKQKLTPVANIPVGLPVGHFDGRGTSSQLKYSKEILQRENPLRGTGKRWEASVKMKQVCKDPFGSQLVKLEKQAFSCSTQFSKYTLYFVFTLISLYISLSYTYHIL